MVLWLQTPPDGQRSGRAVSVPGDDGRDRRPRASGVDGGGAVGPSLWRSWLYLQGTTRRPVGQRLDLDHVDSAHHETAPDAAVGSADAAETIFDRDHQLSLSRF